MASIVLLWACLTVGVPTMSVAVQPHDARGEDALAFSPDGRWLLVGPDAAIYDAQSHALVAHLELAPGVSPSTTFFDGDALYSCGPGGLHPFELGSWRALPPLPGLLPCARITHSSRRFRIVPAPSLLTVEGPDGAPIAQLREAGTDPTFGDDVLVTHLADTFTVYRIGDWKQVSRFVVANRGIDRGIAVRGSTLYTAEFSRNERRMRAHWLPSGMRRWALDLPGGPLRFALDAAGRRAVVALYTSPTNGSLAVVDARRGRVLAVLPVAGVPTSVALSPDGKHLAYRVKGDETPRFLDFAE